MAVSRSIPQLTVQQYLELERTSPFRHEYVDGLVYAMAGGTPRHGAISANVIVALGSRLSGKRCQVYTSDVKVQITPTRYVYPDVSVRCNDPVDTDVFDPDDEEFVGNACLVVEVLSPSTRDYDRTDKFDLYRDSAALRDYVLVDTQHVEVEVRHRSDADKWETRFFGPEDDVVLDSIGVRLPISAFYSGITVSE